MGATIDLAPFCATERQVLFTFRTRSITQPFSRGAWTYATDGRILVRVPRRDDVEESPAAPHAERIIEPYPLAAEMQPLPHFEFPTVEMIVCVRCDGHGSKHGCPTCNCECESCGGSGYAEMLVTGGIGDAIYQAGYLKLLATLPGVMVPMSPPPGETPMRFTFDGGEGLLLGYGSHGDIYILPTRLEAA